MTDEEEAPSSGRVAWAVAFIAMSMLGFELVMTRIFSVILWNHFAFLAISVGLFGFGIAGVGIHLMPGVFRRERAWSQIRACALALPAAIWIVVAILCVLPIRMDFSSEMFGYLVVIFFSTCLPFVLGGGAITLALTHWPRRTNRIYAYDLVGSGLGCGLVILLLHYLDGPTAALALAALPIAAALILRPTALALALLAIVLAGSGLNSVQGLVRVTMARSEVQEPIFERWNAFSRVAVFPSTGWQGWWMAEDTPEPRLETLDINIDADAFTPMVRFTGDLQQVSRVLADLTSAVYHLKPNAERALVFGAGGGKDVLAALASGARSVRAVEINPIIARDIVSERFRDFSGDLYRHPQVELVVREGRTALRHDDGRYDTLQISMVDTSAASAAGAYALTENALYTVEAAVEYIRHLRPEGIVSATTANLPNLEAASRLVSIFAEALRREGYTDLGRRIVVLAGGTPHPFPLFNVLVKTSGFTESEIAVLERLVETRHFEPIHVPGLSARQYERDATVIGRLIQGEDLEGFYESHALDLRPVSDDRPFFFYQYRFRDVWDAFTRWDLIHYGNGLTVLIKLLVISAGAVALFMGLPLLMFRRSGLGELRSASMFGCYFLCLGIGFILLEIALVQMFGYYLGHPLLGLGVSLASLLISTGIGSALGGSWTASSLLSRLRVVLVAIVLVAALYRWLLPVLIGATAAYPVVVRCGIAVLALAPLGLLLGLPFPTGLRLLGERTGLVPWMWALNAGATVFGATFATMTVIHVGFSATILIGAAPYALAVLWLQGIRSSRTDGVAS